MPKQNLADSMPPLDSTAIWERIEAIAQRSPKSLVPLELLARLKPAAVLIPFYSQRDHPHLLFTKRSQNLPSHQGEISFPGGGRHTDDSDLVQTALRETWEELGIAPQSVRIIGVFDEVVSIAGYRVTPFVARIPPPPVPAVNRSEVQEVIEVDVIRLMDETIHRKQSVRRWGYEYDLHFYDYGDHVIWGMTGGLVHRLLGWLKDPQL